MARTLEELVIKLTADNADLKRKLAQSGADVRGFSGKAQRDFSSLTTSVRNLGAAIGVAFAVNKLRDFASAAIELGSSLSDASQRIGITAEALQSYRIQAQDAGIDSGTLDSALQSFAKTFGQLQSGIGRATKQLAALDPALLASMQSAPSVEAAYRLVAEAIRDAAEAGDQQRAAAIAAATGMSSLLGILKEGPAAFDAVTESAKRSGEVLSNETVKALDEFGDAIDRVKRVALAGFAEGLAGVESSAQSFTAVLTDPETLRGMQEAANAIGRIVGALASFVSWSAKASQSPFWRGKAQSIFGEWLVPDLPGSHGASGSWGGSAGGASGSWGATTDTVGPPIIPRRTGGGGGGGSRSSGNRAPTLDYSITHFKFFAAEAKSLSETLKTMDADFDAMKEASAIAADEGVEHFRRMESAAEAFGSFAGNLFSNFARDRKIDFADLAISFGEMLVEMQFKAAASAVFKAAGGSGGGGAGILGGLIGGIGKLFGFADGAIVTRPTLAVVGEGREAEGVFPLSKLPQSRTVVNVINNTGAQVQTQRRRARGTEITDIYIGGMRGAIASGQGRDEMGRKHAPGVG